MHCINIATRINFGVGRKAQAAFAYTIQDGLSSCFDLEHRNDDNGIFLLPWPMGEIETGAP